MKTGKIKFINKPRKFGFIISDDDGKEIYFHTSGVCNGVDLHELQRVEFDTEIVERGIKAISSRQQKLSRSLDKTL